MPEFSPKNKQEQDTYDMAKAKGIATGLLLGVQETSKSLAAAEYDATHDKLTGFLNKDAWKKRASEFIETNDDVAVLFVDLTNFKAINDNAPARHIAGDWVLTRVSAILSDKMRSRDIDLASHERLIQQQQNEAGRYGGDEFAFVLDLTPRDEETKKLSKEERMNVVIDRLREGIDEFKEETPELQNYGFDVAIGGAVKTPGMEAEQLVIAADHAMEKNKSAQHEANGSYR